MGAATSFVMYGAAGGGGSFPATTSSNLYTIDPSTGGARVVGPIGQSLTGMAWNPTTGVLYGVTTGKSACPRCLITIDTATGAGTVVGTLSISPIAELAFRSDGTLFGWSEKTDDLVTINLTTASVTVVGDSATSTYGDAMEFTSSGTLYIFPRGDNGRYYTVNTSTGALTQAGTVSATPFPGATCSGLALSSGTIDPATGTFYASRTAFCGAGPVYPTDLLRIDLATGAATRIGALPGAIDALAFAPAVPAIPALDPKALAMLAVLLAVAAFFALRR